MALAGRWRPLRARAGCGGSIRALGWCGCAAASLLRRSCGWGVCWRPVIGLLTQSVVVGEVGCCVGMRWRADGGMGVLRTEPVATDVRVYNSRSFVEMCMVSCLSASPEFVCGWGAATWGCPRLRSTCRRDSPAPLYHTTCDCLSFCLLVGCSVDRRLPLQSLIVAPVCLFVFWDTPAAARHPRLYASYSIQMLYDAYRCCTLPKMKLCARTSNKKIANAE